MGTYISNEPGDKLKSVQNPYCDSRMINKLKIEYV